MSMTKEEAIEALQKFVNGYEKNICGESVRQNGFVQAIKVVISALRPITREQVEMVWRGEWILDEDDGKYQCDNCKIKFPVNYNFCPYCGSAKTGKAMQKVIWKLERLEGMKNG